MFFLSWGTKDAIAELGPAGLRHCPVCEHEASFTRRVAYRIRHAYWLFRWTTGRTLFDSCDRCGAGQGVDPAEVAKADVRAAIPFWDRRGWTIGVGAIASLVGVGAIASAQDSRATDAYLAAPRVGDVYVADIARLMAKPDAPVMISAMRVTRVAVDSVELEPSTLYYRDSRGIDRDHSSGKTAQQGYYAKDRLVVRLDGLKKMRSDGIVSDVYR